MHETNVYYRLSLFMQNPGCMTGQFLVCEIHKDVHISDFIKERHGSFDNWRVFYESSQSEEDLLFKKVVYVQKDRVEVRH